MRVFLSLLFLPALLSAQALFTPPDDLDHRKAYIWSEGTRMAAELFSKKLVTIPQITHYGVYREARQEAQKRAVEWFDKYLATSPK